MFSYCRFASGSAPAYGSMALVLTLRIPSAYPSLRVAQLGNALGYYLSRLTALGLSRVTELRGFRLHFREARRSGERQKTNHKRQKDDKVSSLARQGT